MIFDCLYAYVNHYKLKSICLIYNKECGAEKKLGLWLLNIIRKYYGFPDGSAVNPIQVLKNHDLCTVRTNLSFFEYYYDTLSLAAVMYKACQFQYDRTTIMVILESMETKLKDKFLNDVGKWAKLMYASMNSKHHWKLFRDDGITHSEVGKTIPIKAYYINEITATFLKEKEIIVFE